MGKILYSVPYGRGDLEFELPSGMRATVVTSNPGAPLPDPEEAVEEALARPVNSPPLRELAGPGQKVCIAFTDITRASPDHLLVPPVIREVESAGVRGEDITLLCATGMHRPSTFGEKVSKLGEDLVARYRVVDHKPTNRGNLVELGVATGGVPISVNRLASEADLLIATGIVEPHQYAGYSGGRKTVGVGLGGEPLIAHTHGPAMVDHPGTRLGRIEGNPFHEAIAEASQRAGLRFIINVVLDEEKRPVAILAGEPEETFAGLVARARRLYEVPIPRQYDVAVAGVGFPKDLNLYQATRAVSYLFFAPTPAVKEGGVFILPVPTPEGVGEGVGERRFLEKMQGATDIPALLAELRRTGYPPGAQRAFIMARVLEKTSVIVAGSQRPEIVRELRMIPAPDMDTAFRMASEKLGRKDLQVLIVPHAMLTLPIISGPGPAAP